MTDPAYPLIRNAKWLARILSAALFLTAQPALATTPSVEEFSQKVEEYMAAAEQVLGFNGSILVADAGQPLLDQGYGYANIELSVPNSPDTVFLLGSVTKQFTGMAIAMLQEQGKLKVSDLACQYLQGCPDSWAGITIQQLLWHTSGIANYTSFQDFAVRTLTPINTAEMIEMLRDRPLDFAPGTSQSYSNSGYFLLGSIIEAVSGQTYAGFLQENIFGPLGMQHTAYDVLADIVPHRAAGYVRRNGQLYNALYTDMTVPGAAGALRSTTRDLLLWDQALYTEKLVSKASLAEIFTPHEGDEGYGYGWSIGKRSDRTVFAHGGGIYGFSTYIARFVDDHVTTIVLSNIEGAPSGKIANDLAAIYLGDDYEVPKEQQAIVLPVEVLQSFTGQYQVNDELVIDIKMVDDMLVAELVGRMTFGLLPASETEFFSKDVELKLAFEKSASGEVTGFVLNPGPDGMPAVKIK